MRRLVQVERVEQLADAARLQVVTCVLWALPGDVRRASDRGAFELFSN